jgi:heterokaryon incompatibility protein (HET)
LPQRNVKINRDQDEVYSTINGLLELCGTHIQCEFPPETLPTRLLDVSGESDMIKLIHNSDGTKGHYVTLSYTWGSAKPAVTMKTNLENHMNGILISSLPRTLQDAIKVTRAVKVPYLWIDALCIIQDDASDKEREMACMQQIFQKSYLTIAAACSANSDEGIFTVFTENPPFVSLPIIFDENQASSLLLSERKPGQMEPLHERAWVLQEIVLSPRLLIFGRACVFWLCESKGAQVHGSSKILDWNGYCASSGLTTLRVKKNGAITLPRLSTQTPNLWAILTSRQAERLPILSRNWKLVVSDYSSRKLTHPSDKLPALSGVVTYFQRAMEDKYLAGLWQKQLFHELSWKALEGKRTTIWRAPSWSWMSVDGQISWEADLYEWFSPAVEIRLCEVVPATHSAPFSHVKSGKLVLFGDLQPYAHLERFMVLDDEHDSAELSGSIDGQFWCLKMANCSKLSNSDDAVGTSHGHWGLLLWKVEPNAFKRAGYYRSLQVLKSSNSSRQEILVI